MQFYQYFFYVFIFDILYSISKHFLSISLYTFHNGCILPNQVPLQDLHPLDRHADIYRNVYIFLHLHSSERY